MLAIAVDVPAAHGQTSPRYVTFVARQCPSYTAIAANRARNNIQESLRDLGVDSAYSAGDAMNPDIEAEQSPDCSPLVNWRFTMGEDYETRAVDGPWGSLSRVTEVFDTSIVTNDSVPLRDSDFNPVGDRMIEGAVTVRLTTRQAQLAGASSRLWVQGGIPDDPVLFGTFGETYGFGALRCGIDILNGDNVEWIAFPTGAEHVFCFAYYVRPPPESGTIIVNKVVDDPAVTATETFTFQGDISYTPDRTFDLRASGRVPGSITFYRAGGQTWSWRERDLAGWDRIGLSCSSATGQSGSVTDVATGSVSVDLAAGDTVTCTHTNRPAPPPAGLTLAKRTLGGVGSFRFDVRGPQDRSQTITTEEEDTLVEGETLELRPGTYEVTEEPPPRTPEGRWQVRSVQCDGAPLDPARSISVTLRAGEGRACQFVNEFIPAGSITVRKRTYGAPGTAGFIIRPVDHPAVSFEQRATTEREGQTVKATGDDTSDLELGRYEIVETGPVVRPGGHWRLESVICDGVPRGSALGRAVVTLTRSNPRVDCTFVNRFVRGDEPDQPGIPGGADGTEPADDTPAPRGRSFGPKADLRITKRAVPSVARVGEPVRYTVRVVNRGPGVAYDVVGTEVRAPRQAGLSLRASKGRCRTSPRPVRCVVGRLRPGERATITVVQRTRIPGRVRNSVAVVSSTDDPNLANNRATATLTSRVPTPPRVTG
jgi:Domain of unknown function DUF11